VQGDEPFIHPDGLASLIEVFKSDTKKEIDLASLMIPIFDEINNPNVVKVITDLYNRALYFSRSAIPHQRSKETHAIVYKHVGVYASRKSALIDFYEHAPTPLELAEQIEAIRYLEMGKTIQMIETQFEGVGIDAPEDLERAKKLMS
jgi:3-deoxy-manno-octulosonate cytidylyltransferase (CMP-KDO synthetase)